MIIPRFTVATSPKLNVYHFTPNASKSAPVIVFTHPTGFTSAMYSAVCAHLRGFNIFGLDIRCHGLSEAGDIHDWNAFNEDLDALYKDLESRTGKESFIGVGISSGASAHILHSSVNIGRYSSLVLCEPILFKPETDLSHREFLAKSARNRRSDFESRSEVFDRFRKKGALSQLSESALALYAIYGFKNIPGGVALSCSKEDEESIYLSGAANGVFEALKNVPVPALVVNGENSNTITESFANEISDQLPHGSHKQMPGVGHFTLFENPALGAQIIGDFINGNSKA